MASFLTCDFDDGDENHLPPVSRKSQIPVRVTRLSSDSDRSSSEDEEAENRRTPKDSVAKLPKKRQSKIPVIVAQKTRGGKDKLPGHETKGEKPMERDSGINLPREKQSNKLRIKATENSTAAGNKSPRPPDSPRPVKETTTRARTKTAGAKTPARVTRAEQRATNRVPGGAKKPAFLEQKEVNPVSEEAKGSRDEISASEESLTESTNEVTPTFECNIPALEDDEWRSLRENTNLSDGEFDDDFERYSSSSDERDLPNVPSWLRDAVKEHTKRNIEAESSAENLASEENDQERPSTEARRPVIFITQPEYETEENSASARPQNETPQRVCSAIQPEHDSPVDTSRDKEPDPRLETEAGEENVDGEKFQQSDADCDKNIESPLILKSKLGPLDQDPSWVYNDFDADELSQIIVDLSTMTADMTAEEHAEAMLPLIMLRDEARERDKAMELKRQQEAANIVPDPAQMAALRAIAERLDAQLSDDADGEDLLDLQHNTCLEDEDDTGGLDRDTVFLRQFDPVRGIQHDELTFEEAMATVPVPEPRRICTNDFDVDELSQMIADLSFMSADMTEEEHAEALFPLLMLREEARQREMAMEQIKRSPSPQPIMAEGAACSNVAPNSSDWPCDKYGDHHVHRKGEFDTSFMPMPSSEDMAALNEIARRLDAKLPDDSEWNSSSDDEFERTNGRNEIEEEFSDFRPSDAEDDELVGDEMVEEIITIEEGCSSRQLPCSFSYRGFHDEPGNWPDVSVDHDDVPESKVMTAWGEADDTAMLHDEKEDEAVPEMEDEQDEGDEERSKTAEETCQYPVSNDTITSEKEEKVEVEEDVRIEESACPDERSCPLEDVLENVESCTDIAMEYDIDHPAVESIPEASALSKEEEADDKEIEETLLDAESLIHQDKHAHDLPRRRDDEGTGCPVLKYVNIIENVEPTEEEEDVENKDSCCYKQMSCSLQEVQEESKHCSESTEHHVGTESVIEFLPEVSVHSHVVSIEEGKKTEAKEEIKSEESNSHDRISCSLKDVEEDSAEHHSAVESFYEGSVYTDNKDLRSVEDDEEVEDGSLGVENLIHQDANVSYLAGHNVQEETSKSPTSMYAVNVIKDTITEEEVYGKGDESYCPDQRFCSFGEDQEDADPEMSTEQHVFLLESPVEEVSVHRENTDSQSASNCGETKEESLDMRNLNSQGGQGSYIDGCDDHGENFDSPALKDAPLSDQDEKSEVNEDEHAEDSDCPDQRSCSFKDDQEDTEHFSRSSTDRHFHCPEPDKESLPEVSDRSDDNDEKETLDGPVRKDVNTTDREEIIVVEEDMEIEESYCSNQKSCFFEDVREDMESYVETCTDHHVTDTESREEFVPEVPDQSDRNDIVSHVDEGNYQTRDADDGKHDERKEIPFYPVVPVKELLLDEPSIGSGCLELSSRESSGVLESSLPVEIDVLPGEDVFTCETNGTSSLSRKISGEFTADKLQPLRSSSGDDEKAFHIKGAKKNSPRPNLDAFIDAFDSLLDEAEEDIRAESSRSSSGHENCVPVHEGCVKEEEKPHFAASIEHEATQLAVEFLRSEPLFDGNSHPLIELEVDNQSAVELLGSERLFNDNNGPLSDHDVQTQSDVLSLVSELLLDNDKPLSERDFHIQSAVESLGSEPLFDDNGNPLFKQDDHTQSDVESLGSERIIDDDDDPLFVHAGEPSIHSESHTDDVPPISGDDSLCICDTEDEPDPWADFPDDSPRSAHAKPDEPPVSQDAFTVKNEEAYEGGEKESAITESHTSKPNACPLHVEDVSQDSERQLDVSADPEIDQASVSEYLAVESVHSDEGDSIYPDGDVEKGGKLPEVVHGDKATPVGNEKLDNVRDDKCHMESNDLLRHDPTKTVLLCSMRPLGELLLESPSIDSSYLEFSTEKNNDILGSAILIEIDVPTSEDGVASVTNDPFPLVKKKSERFKENGFQTFVSSPGAAESAFHIEEGKSKSPVPNADAFIDELDSLLDEAEEDIRAQESRSFSGQENCSLFHGKTAEKEKEQLDASIESDADTQSAVESLRSEPPFDNNGDPLFSDEHFETLRDDVPSINGDSSLCISDREEKLDLWADFPDDSPNSARTRTDEPLVSLDVFTINNEEVYEGGEKETAITEGHACKPNSCSSSVEKIRKDCEGQLDMSTGPKVDQASVSDYLAVESVLCNEENSPPEDDGEKEKENRQEVVCEHEARLVSKCEIENCKGLEYQSNEANAEAQNPMKETCPAEELWFEVPHVESNDTVKTVLVKGSQWSDGHTNEQSPLVRKKSGRFTDKGLKSLESFPDCAAETALRINRTMKISLTSHADEFIEELDSLLDEAEEDIRVEESLSSSGGTPSSRLNDVDLVDEDDELISNSQADSVVESLASVSVMSDQDDSLTSCDKEVADINGDCTESVSENNLDSWDVLDALVPPVLSTETTESHYLKAIVTSVSGVNHVDGCWHFRSERFAPTLTDIAEEILQRELSDAIKAVPSLRQKDAETSPRDQEKDVSVTMFSNESCSKQESNTLRRVYGIPSEAENKETCKGSVEAMDSTQDSDDDKMAIAAAITKVEKLHADVSEIRRDFQGKTGAQVKVYTADDECYSGPILLERIQRLHVNIVEMSEEFNNEKQRGKEDSTKRQEKLQQELIQLKKDHFRALDQNIAEFKALRRTNKELRIWLEEGDQRSIALERVIESTNEENEKLLKNMNDLQEQMKSYNFEKDASRTEAKSLQLELKNLRSKEVFNERELANLRNDIERKESVLERMGNDLDEALLEKQDLLYDIVSLEDDLKESQTSKEELNCVISDMKKMMKNLKAELEMVEKKTDYGYLREKVELLEGYLALGNHREEVFKSELDTLKAEKVHLAYLQRSKEISQQIIDDEKDVLMNNLHQQASALQIENQRMAKDLSSKVDKADLLVQLREQVENLQNQNKALQEESLETRKQLEERIRVAGMDARKLSEESMHSRRHHKGSKEDVRKLRRRVRQNEQEIECLGKFIQRRGLQVGNTREQHLVAQLDQHTEVAKISLMEETNKFDELKCVLQKQIEKSKALERQMSKMAKVLERTSECVKERENELAKTESAFRQQSKRTDELENQAREIERLLEMTRQSLEQKEKDLEQREDELREQKRREEELKLQLHDMEKLLGTTIECVKERESETELANSNLKKRDGKVEELAQELKQEKMDKKSLRKALDDATECTTKREKTQENEVNRLRGLLRDRDNTAEKSNRHLRELKMELGVMRGMLAQKAADLENSDMSPREEHGTCDLFRKQLEDVDLGEKDCTFLNVNEYLVGTSEEVVYLRKRLWRRQEELDESAQLLEQRENETQLAQNLLEEKSMELERLRTELFQRGEEVEGLTMSLQGSADEGESARRRLKQLEEEASHLRKRLQEKEKKVGKLEASVKQLEQDLERTQLSLKEKETELERAATSLQLKDSALVDVNADLCRVGDELEALKTLSREREFEVEQLRRALEDLRTILEHSANVLTKKDDEICHLRVDLNGCKRSASEKSLQLEQKIEELKALKLELDGAEVEKQNLLEENAATSKCLEEERMRAEEQEKTLKEQVNTAVRNLETKRKLIWDVKMKLKETVARVSKLQAEKLEMERREAERKRKNSSEARRLNDAVMRTSEDYETLQAMPGSVDDKMFEFRRENEQLRLGSPQEIAAQPCHDAVDDVCDHLAKEHALLKCKIRKAAWEVHKRDEMDKQRLLQLQETGTAVDRIQTDRATTWESGYKGIDRKRRECFLSPRSQVLNGNGQLPPRDSNMLQCRTAPRPTGQISILLYT